MHRRLELIAIALVFATIDLSYKLATPADYHHARSRFAALAIAGVVLGLIVFVPRVPSRAAVLGAAVAAGGALGNLVSLFVWQQGVPDPLVPKERRVGSRSTLRTCSRSRATCCC